MRTVIGILTTLGGLFLGQAFSLASDQEVSALIKVIDGQQQKIQSLAARFFQKNETSLAREPLLSSGSVKFKRPHRIHWTYGEPERMEVALDEKYIWFYNPGRFQAEQYSLARGKGMAQYLEPLASVFQKTFAHLAKEYAISYERLETDNTYHFRLRPKSKKIPQVISRLDLWIDKTSGAILRCKILAPNGDQLSLEFKNLQINPPLTDDDLKIKIPPSVRVLEPILP